MIILPFPPRRVWLTSFWLAISVSTGLLGATLLWLLVSPPSVAIGGGLALGLAATGFLWSRRIVSRAYNIWNTLASYYVRGARFVLFRLCFYLTLVTVGRVGNSLTLGRVTAATSLWVPRSTLPPNTYGSQWAVPREHASRKGWVRNFLSWTFHSGNLWAVFLLPSLLLLGMLEKDEESSLPSNIYTLF